MAIIYNYPLNSILLAEDMLIGTSTKIVNGQPKNATKNFSIGDLTGFIKGNVSLDDVLQVGNTSLLDAKIGGLYLYDTPVADYGNIVLNQNRFSFNTVTHGEVFRAQRDMFSSFSSSGYRGSFEVSSITANRVWDLPNKSGTVALLSDVPVGTTPTWQETLDVDYGVSNIVTTPFYYDDGAVRNSNDIFGIRTEQLTGNLLSVSIVPGQVAAFDGVSGKSIYIDYDFGIKFYKVISSSGKSTYIKADNVINNNVVFQLPNKPTGDYTLATLDDIPIIPIVGTWGALNYPAWTTGTPFVKMTAAGTFALDTTTYYPYPTGTISQYIRGDGSLATFPTITIPTLQQVTAAGSTTTNGLQITDTLNYLYLNQDASIAFQNSAGGYGDLRSDLLTNYVQWQLPDAWGTIALIENIPTLVAGTNITIDDTDPLNPIISATGGGGGGVTSVGLTMPSAFNVGSSPITTSGTIAVTGAGTSLQYIRGDGSLATFPSTAIPTLQQVVTAGNIITTSFTHSSVSFENTFNASSINIIDKNIPGLNSGVFYQVNGIYRTYAGSTQSLLFAPFDGLAPYSRTIIIPNASGTIALLSDIPPSSVSPLTTKGDLYTFNTVDARLPVGLDTQVLIADSTTSTGLKWGTVAAVTSLNSLTGATQTMVAGTSGTDFAISSASATHTFNLPTASAANRGALSSTDWSVFNSKQNSLGYKPYRFIDTANAVSVTGTTAETTLLTITIPPNSFAANDVINIPFLSIVKTGNAGNCGIRLRVSSTNVMATATQIALFTAVTTQINPTISRHYSLNGGFLRGLNATTSVVNDIFANGTSQVLTAFDTTITQYLFITVTNGSIADSTSLMGVQITN